jgi:hypothetical protein
MKLTLSTRCALWHAAVNLRHNLQPVRLAGWLVLICSERKVLLIGCW